MVWKLEYMSSFFLLEVLEPITELVDFSVADRCVPLSTSSRPEIQLKVLPWVFKRHEWLGRWISKARPIELIL